MTNFFIANSNGWPLPMANFPNDQLLHWLHDHFLLSFLLFHLFSLHSLHLSSLIHPPHTSIWHLPHIISTAPGRPKEARMLVPRTQRQKQSVLRLPQNDSCCKVQGTRFPFRSSHRHHRSLSYRHLISPRELNLKHYPTRTQTYNHAAGPVYL